MKVALVTTPPSVHSGIGDYTRHLLPYLREHAQVDVFVEAGLDDQKWGGEPARLTRDLAPREYDQILYQLGNEVSHAFMPRMIRALGGTVVQHDWVLFDMAAAAFPGIARGGVKGHALALREGGVEQMRIYSRNWLDRRRARRTPLRFEAEGELEGVLLCGWYATEPKGRWTSDRATFRVPAEGVNRLRLHAYVEPGRTAHLLLDERVVGRLEDGECEVELQSLDRPIFALETSRIRVTPEQRAHGDSRRLGAFVRAIEWEATDGWGWLDLDAPPALPIAPVTLARDRFRLPFNRSVVRFADAFIVHSRFVAERIRVERNAATPIALVHHGSERRWRDEDKCRLRKRLGLNGSWIDGFLVTSFGGVQPHKRIDKALEAIAAARCERPDVHLVLAGSVHSGDFDPRAMARRLGIADAVHFTGFVTEEAGWDWLTAGDVSLNLRGPTSGGTSGGIFQAFSVGRPVIASDAAEQRELPDSCVVKIPLDGSEVVHLARALVDLRDDPQRCAQLCLEARRFVESECHWSLVARKYAEAMARFPPARATRRLLVARPAGMGQRS